MNSTPRQPNLFGPAAEPVIDLTSNRIAFEGSHGRCLVDKLTALLRRDRSECSYEYIPGAGRAEHRAAAVAWLLRWGIVAPPERIIICNGVQHGLMLTLDAIAEPGDLAVAEELNYPGLQLLHAVTPIRLRGLPIDQDGLCPDALESACKSDNVRFLICSPTVHNPTNSVMPSERRRRIVEIARHHGLTIIEYDANGIGVSNPPPPFCQLAPERSYYITSTWKSTGLGISIGYAVVPAESISTILAALQAATWATSPFLASVVSAWILDGTAEQIDAWHRQEIHSRLATAQRAIGHVPFTCHPSSYNLWLSLPEPWRREDFIAQVARHSVRIAPSEVFIVGRAIAPHAVRISLGGMQDRALVESGLEAIASVLAEGPMPIRIIA